ncbi:hypothetical protein COT48_05970 [Candidatus Woesearchaeota archaeon CG08_land_8_20_14_0_20_47_9]|nr:MAG: hypothetical protein AUJ69_02635 [Candidatus Woesearchaeota archaeon CG1_02_47_18]PIO03149.1 MAG: hypothetical protein COT48_05970 [Candidatus Woesearchaeota archaeon CG08_land_8_20_14_0_20_47_9]HII30138.1 NTP transferase domain-containing protein [Candidatus Woesearchaeota archaeon]
MKRKISITIGEGTLRQIDSLVDGVYIRNRSQAIEQFVRNSISNQCAVILCGGKEQALRLGRGYRPTARVKNSTVIELAVRTMREHGFKRMFIIARHNVLTDIFRILKDGNRYAVKINYIEEVRSAGTADSLRLVRGRVSSAFLTVYGDIVFSRINIEELWNQHIKQKAVATIVLTTSSAPSSKGSVKVEGNRVVAFEQKVRRAESYLVFSPIFVAEPEFLDYAGSSLEKDVFPELAARGMLSAYISSEKERHIHRQADLGGV